MITNEALKEAIQAVEENNRINDAQWSDWQDATDIREVYEIKHLSKRDIATLEEAINTNGKSLII